MATFPPNPDDGMVVELLPGLFYQYSRSTNCWVRIDSTGLGIASCSLDGLMSAADLKKLNDLIVPPPRISIRSEDCETGFDSGIVNLFSSDESLEISSTAEFTESTDRPRMITTEMGGFNFGVDLDKLIADLKAKGNYTEIQIQGVQGEIGQDGVPGRDSLDTGPIGEAGEDGTNAAFPGSIINESLQFEVDSSSRNRAIINIEADSTTGKLLITRANVGDPTACPAKVQPLDFDSPWVLVLNDSTDLTITKKTIGSLGDCTFTCQVCAASIHYLDLSNILVAIEDRFESLINEMKVVKEEQVADWLKVMITMYGEQKAAICCALENCKSRTRNKETRQYIESQRIQALQADHSVIVDGKDDRVTIDMEEDCPLEQADGAVTGEPCEDCQLALTVDGVIHAGSDRNAVVGELPAGQYIAEILGCCITTKQPKGSRIETSKVIEGGQIVDSVITIPGQPGSYTGRVIFRYVGDDAFIDVAIPDFGSFDSDAEAQSVYEGYTFGFSHQGGEIKAWFPDSFPQNNSGSVELCIRPTSCFELGTGTGTDLENFETFEEFFDTVDSCEMRASQVEWYQRGWQIGACCGAYVDFNGIKYLIVKRSIGTDTTCGAAESLEIECIRDFINSGKGHPAIAWPSLDGFEFDGLPSGSATFVESPTLSDGIVAQLRAGNTIEEKGDTNNIDLIIFASVL